MPRTVTIEGEQVKLAARCWCGDISGPPNFEDVFAMRSFVYVIAVLAAAGIAYWIAVAPPEQTVQQAVVSEASPENASQVLVDAGTLVLRVDDMHCQYNCYPKVKETLQGFDGVVAVELDEQGDNETFNPQVVIDYDPGFDLGAAQGALAGQGFAKSSVVP